MAKRLLFIDVAKGSAILGVVLVHALIVGVWFVPGNALSVLPVWVLAILSPLVIISTWAGFFELMSGLANMYNLYDRLVVKEMPFKKASRGALVNSTGLLLVHFIFIFLFSHRRNAPYPAVGDSEIHTTITGTLELGQLYITDFQYFFFASVLGSIALAGYFSVLIIYILYKLQGFDNINRLVASLTVITAGFFFLSYPIWDIGNDFLVNALQNRGFLLVPAFVLAPFTGAFQPFFPIAGFALIGAIIGLLLSVRNHKEDDPDFYANQSPITVHNYINRVSAASFVVFVGLLTNVLVSGTDPLTIFEFYRLPPTLLALNISLMLLVFKLAIRIFEDPDEETRTRRMHQSLFIRRFGMVTLSVYVLESPVNGLFSFFFHRFFDDPTTTAYESHVATVPIIAYTLFVVVFWFVVVRLWERVGFKYSIEYWVIRFGSKFRSTESSKLNLDRILYNPLGRSQYMITENEKAQQKTPVKPVIEIGDD